MMMIRERRTKVFRFQVVVKLEADIRTMEMMRSATIIAVVLETLVVSSMIK